MAYVEEEILEEPIQVPPDSLLYMVSDPQDRPSTNIATMDTETTMEGATCIVQEEIPQMDRPTEPPLLNSDTE
jgi:di/tripeptidase